ncbi:SLATT domain-containing protein [Psychrilyobacter atlanticus]|uniref:SLATT domain-containing protein n=1 Tax=Psychrilyobacter atlanticus TaxID=271091 RepID=UPI0003F585EC
MKQGYYNNLKRNIYITRKCRINLSERLLKKNKCWNYINFIYSLCLIGLAILGLKKNIGTANYNLLMVFLSVSVTMISLYSNTQNYKERALSLKFHYIKLQSMYIELSHLNFNTHFQRIKKIENEYLEELKLSENHIPRDRYFSIKEDPQEIESLKRISWIKKIYYHIFFYEDYIWFILFILPILFFYQNYTPLT